VNFQVPDLELFAGHASIMLLGDWMMSSSQ
jgi:hypothetical protein